MPCSNYLFTSSICIILDHVAILSYSWFQPILVGYLYFYQFVSTIITKELLVTKSTINVCLRYAMNESMYCQRENTVKDKIFGMLTTMLSIN